MTGQEGRQVPAAEVNHAAFDHEQLKQWTDDADPGTSQAFADEWTRTGAALVDAAETLKRAVGDSETGWTGEAADAMRSRLGQISAWSGGTGSQIAAAGQSVARQSEAADTARRSMPEPVPYDPAQMIRDAGRAGLLGMATLPQQLFAQKQKHDAAHEEAVRVVAERDAAMSAAAANVALFQPPPALDRPADERTFVDSGDFSAPGGDGTGSGGARVPGGGSGDGGDPSAGGPRPGGAGHGGSGADGSGDGGAPSPGGGAPPSPGTTTPGSFGPGRESAPVGVGPPGAASGSSAGGTPGFGVGGPLGGVGGVGGTSGGLGSGGTGSGTRGGAPGPGVGRGAGLPGTAPGATVAAGGVRGAAAVGGLPTGVGAGRREDDDVEHKRAEFLQEPDPDGIFDSDVLTAPSVIGGPDDE